MTRRDLLKLCDALWSKIILSRGRCQICYSRRNLEPHHIISKRYAATRFDPENGACVCNHDHGRLTRHEIYLITLKEEQELKRKTKKWTVPELLELRQHLKDSFAELQGKIK